jgi:4-hydroxyproline epimerase
MSAGQIIPRITGAAYVTAEATLILDPDDPFQMGMRG